VSVADPDGPATGCAEGSEQQGLFDRLRDSYQSHLAWDGGEAAASPPNGDPLVEAPPPAVVLAESPPT